jgi:hypothetical protein
MKEQFEAIEYALRLTDRDTWIKAMKAVLCFLLGHRWESCRMWVQQIRSLSRGAVCRRCGKSEWFV